MLNSTTLEVAIGMALIYLLLSLFCTAINEAIAGILGSRAKNLEKGIQSLFSGGALKLADKGPAQTYAQAIYDHGLVQSLYRTDKATGVAQWIRGGSQLPSYIPSRTFAIALFDILFQRDKTSKFADAARPAGEQPAPLDLGTMLKMLRDLPDSKAKEAFTALVRQSGGDIAKTRQAFEQWFDDGMDRCAGWYKRRTQFALFILGLIVALTLNVDSIAVSRALWTSPALRSYAVTVGEQYGKTQPAAGEITKNLADLQSLALPVGWNGRHYTFLSTDGESDSLLFAIAGWLLTAIAMTLGAPFWFDLLNQFMVVRSTIKPREKSEVEGSKDSQPS
ncbi:hypothetical protein [Acidicapsa acidisoli]|uniref:hypothetical protein n=1 Tax=Acidicapsa acidisoli TaxID=1615681 RepID=UPI0021DFF22D|nr:hypothetical protein [Acidicapsa acidisoli]